MSIKHTLEELERLARAATPGNWSAEPLGELAGAYERLIAADLGKTQDGIQQIRSVCRTFQFAGRDESLANAAFIAAASPATILSLVEEVREMEAKLGGRWGPVVLDEEEFAEFERVMTTPAEPTPSVVAAAEMLRTFPRGWQTNELAIMKGLIATGCTDEQLAAGFSAKASDIERARAALLARAGEEK